MKDECTALPTAFVGADYGVDITEVLANICEHLASINCVIFQVVGFRDIDWPSKDNRWPVDIRTDLLTVVPELPAVINSLEYRSTVNIGAMTFLVGHE